ncbi:MAG: sugar phosphate isomerase/epimerase family protein [Candidatus Excrementavichristensenella sp.]|jgi:sugar phosphate isomerase/epimerase|nr:TIM barrel protein [Bacillota bacterium]NLL54138.1 TIM barrel protein [Clostridiales bacterium]
MAFDRFSFIAGSLCQSGCRFLRSGYKERTMPLDEAIDKMAARGLARGVELHYGGSEPEGHWEKQKRQLEELDLPLTYLNTWIYGERMWRYGALSAADPKVRRMAVERSKRTIDTARYMGALGVGIWLGQDGFDYAFQTDYRAQWNALVDSLKELCDYAEGMPIALEPKPREPRNRSLIDNVQTVLLLRYMTGRDNLGITLDTGHVLAGGQGLGTSISLALSENALYNLHTNDNYGAWDDDMIVGSVRLNEMLEAFYLLEKYEYPGYVSVDIFPYREDSIDAVAESILCMKDYVRVVDKLGVEGIDALIREGNVPKTLGVIRRAVFGKDECHELL